MRVISSTVQGLDIAAEAEDAFCDAVGAGRTVRETYNKNEIGQKDYRIALVGYNDPADGAGRWAVVYENPNEIDWTDTDDLDTATAAYEEQVRTEAALLEPTYDGEGGLARPAGFDFTDVSDVPSLDYTAPNLVLARGIAAVWATQTLQKVQADARRAVEVAATARAVAVAQVVDTFGRGGQSFAADLLEISQPTVADLVRRGRAALNLPSEAPTPPVPGADLPGQKGRQDSEDAEEATVPAGAKVTSAADALHDAWQYSPLEAEPIIDGSSITGWTFRKRGKAKYGWILTDGRVSPALEWSRTDAEQYARNTLAGY